MARQRAAGGTRIRLGPKGPARVMASMDPQVIRVLALTAPASERRRWKWQLRMGTAGQRAAVATALGASLGTSAVLLLKRAALRDVDAGVRIAALDALGLVGGKVALHAVLQCAAGAVESDLPSLIRALARVGNGSARARDVVERAAASREPAVLEAALLTLARWGHPDAATLAMAVAGHSDVRVRRAAWTALDGNGAALALREQALADPDPTVASLAQEALRAFTVRAAWTSSSG